MDVLSRLGARAIGTAAAATSVRPMIAPLFLAAPPDMIRAGADPSPIVQTPRQPVRQALEPDRGPAEPVADPTGDGHHLATPRSQGRQTPVDDFDLASTDSEPPAPEVGRMPRQDTPRPDVPFTTRADPATSAPVDTPQGVLASTRGLDSRRGSDAIVRVHDRREPIAQPESSDDEHRTEVGRPIAGREPDGLSSARYLTRLRAIRESVAAPEASFRDERPPTVRVTIGRIDVRSTPVAAPEPPRQPARTRDSRMTLAEYLTRKRHGVP
jgi:hypothetical protein